MSMVVSHFFAIWKTRKLANPNPTIFPTLDLLDQIPTKVACVLTLKYLLKIVSKAGKKVNWKKPKQPKAIIIINSVKGLAYLSFEVLNNEYRGIMLNDIAVGIAVCRQVRVIWLLFSKE